METAPDSKCTPTEETKMTWELDGSSAKFSRGQFSGSIDLAQPQAGLGVQGPDGLTLAPIAGVTFPDTAKVRLQDCYVRGEDLLCMYPQTAHRHFNIQLQYRVFDRPSAEGAEISPDVLMIELWVSNYTFLLDSYPQVDVELCSLHSQSLHSLQLWEDLEGQLSPVNTEAISTTCIAAVNIKQTANSPAIAVFIHPLDQDDSDLSFSPGGPGESAIAILRLFGRFMEKGVIRRARLRFVLSREEISDEVLRQVYESFAASALPLTT